MQPRADPLSIDGALGEGGGQILRSALALSLCLLRPFRICHIRATRKTPGLRPQHLAAVTAAATVGRAEVQGASLGSRELTFAPRRVMPGEYQFDIGTAGSTTLVLQTVLPALLTASAPSRLVLHGGTHNPLAPPFDFFALTFLPLINRMGPCVKARLRRAGFYPAGGGLVEVTVDPVPCLRPLNLPERGAILRRRAWALLSQLPTHIAERELRVIAAGLGLPADCLELRRVEAAGPGNAVLVSIDSEHLYAVFSGIGQRGVRAEQVALQVVEEVRRYLAAGVPVGHYLADQLLLPLALAGEGRFLTLAPSRHTTTNIEVIARFTGLRIDCQPLGQDRWRIACAAEK